MRINKVFSLQHDSVVKHATNSQCCLTDYCRATPLLDMLEYIFIPLPLFKNLKSQNPQLQ